MIGKILKYGIFLRFYLLFKERLSAWFFYFLLTIIILYSHNEIKEISIVVNNTKLLVWSYVIKNLLLLFLIIIFIKKETNIFKSKNINNIDFGDIHEKNTIIGDGFNTIRNKKTLMTSSEMLLKQKNK